MKRKTLSKVLAIVIMVSLLLPNVALAAPTYDDAYKMALVGTESTFNGRAGIETEMRLLAPTAKGIQKVMLVIDSTKLELISRGNGSTIQIPDNFTASLASTDEEDTPWTLALSNNMTSMLNAIQLDSTHTLLMIQVQHTGSSPTTRYSTELKACFTFALGYKNGITVDDLDKSSLVIASPEIAMKNGQNDVAKITFSNSASDIKVYGNIDRTTSAEGSTAVVNTEKDQLRKPEITYPNSDVTNLNGVKLDALYKYVNVPASLPTAKADVTVNTSVQGYYASDCADGTELNEGVTYTYGLQIKEEAEGAEARDLTEAEQAVLSVDTNGVVTVKAGAPQATLIVSATGSYTNSKSSVSTATGTYEIGLRHGDAHSKNEEDPSDPPKPVGGEPTGDDATKTLTGVEIYLTGDGDPTKVIAADATGTARNYDYPVAKPAEGGAAVGVTFTAKELDQYGDEMATPAGSWSMDAATGITQTNGALSIDNTVTNGDYVLTYTAGAITSTVKITVADKAIVWPTLDKDTLTYGEKVSALTYTGGSASDSNGAIDGVTFEWNTPDTVLGASENKQNVTMSCKDGTEVLGTKDYEITVNRADQEIALADGLTLEGDVLSIEINAPVTLGAVANNKDVQADDGSAIASGTTITYALDTTALADLDGDAGTVTGKTLSANGRDTAKLTISAAGNDNYNAATREVQLFVTKPMLRATITFDTEKPVYGGEITATITEAVGQTGSLNEKVTYTWGKMVTTTEGEETVETFEALGTGTDITGNLAGTTAGVATVKYTPAVADIGSKLALQIVTPSNDASYGWIHSVTTAMANSVGKRAQTVGSWAARKTTTTITVDVIEGAKYAIKEAEVASTAEVADPGDLTWQVSNVFSELTPNTKYNVYVQKPETETDAASIIDMQEVTTDKIAINDEDDSTSPQGGSVAITGNAKYDETLRATVSDPVLGTGEDAQTLDILTTGTYQWYRVTPAVEDDPETEADEKTAEVVEEITGETGATYVIDDALDVGKAIRVVVTVNSDAPYSGSVQADTTTIAKADGPEFTNTLGADKASKADTTDGAITGLTAGTEYEYIVKPVKAEGETEEPTPNWTNATKATADDNGKITGLGVNTYMVRIPATDTHEASAEKEIEVAALGFNITGKVKSYNAMNDITYALFKQVNGAYTEQVKTGTLIAKADSTTSEAIVAEFEISGIENGVYRLAIMKQGHLNFVILNLVVNDGNVDLTAKNGLAEIVMGAGDINNTGVGDGVVNDTDQAIILEFYNMSVTTDEHKLYDINGDGVINDTDQSLILDNYNKGEADFTVTLD